MDYFRKDFLNALPCLLLTAGYFEMDLNNTFNPF